TNEFCPRNFFNTGLLGDVVDFLIASNISYQLLDARDNQFNFISEDFQIGEDIIRPHQAEAVQRVVNNTLRSLYFPRGILDMATNAGKTLVMAHIAKKAPSSLIIVNRTMLFKQLVKKF